MPVHRQYSKRELHPWPASMCTQHGNITVSMQVCYTLQPLAHLHASAVIIMCVLSMLWMKLGGKALRCLALSHTQLSGESLDTTCAQQQQFKQPAGHHTSRATAPVSQPATSRLPHLHPLPLPLVHRSPIGVPPGDHMGVPCDHKETPCASCTRP
jgi:hypothetical protein